MTNSSVLVVAATGLFPSGSFAGDPCKVIFGAFECKREQGFSRVISMYSCADFFDSSNLPRGEWDSWNQRHRKYSGLLHC